MAVEITHHRHDSRALGAIFAEIGPGRYASIWLFHTALINQFNKARPKPGELVLVRYEGMRTPKGGGSDYHDWKVATEHGADTGSGFSWDDLAGGPSPGPVPAPQSTAGSPTGEFWPAAPAPAGDFTAEDDIPF